MAPRSNNDLLILWRMRNSPTDLLCAPLIIFYVFQCSSFGHRESGETPRLREDSLGCHFLLSFFFFFLLSFVFLHTPVQFSVSIDAWQAVYTIKKKFSNKLFELQDPRFDMFTSQKDIRLKQLEMEGSLSISSFIKILNTFSKLALVMHILVIWMCLTILPNNELDLINWLLSGGMIENWGQCVSIEWFTFPCALCGVCGVKYHVTTALYFTNNHVVFPSLRHLCGDAYIQR